MVAGGIGKVFLPAPRAAAGKGCGRPKGAALSGAVGSEVRSAEGRSEANPEAARPRGIRRRADPRGIPPKEKERKKVSAT